eukprot:3422142-Amphidinium_carterae.1
MKSETLRSLEERTVMCPAGWLAATPKPPRVMKDVYLESAGSLALVNAVVFKDRREDVSWRRCAVA